MTNTTNLQHAFLKDRLVVLISFMRQNEISADDQYAICLGFRTAWLAEFHKRPEMEVANLKAAAHRRLALALAPPGKEPPVVQRGKEN